MIFFFFFLPENIFPREAKAPFLKWVNAMRILLPDHYIVLTRTMLICRTTGVNYRLESLPPLGCCIPAQGDHCLLASPSSPLFQPPNASLFTVTYWFIILFFHSCVSAHSNTSLWISTHTYTHIYKFRNRVQLAISACHIDKWSKCWSHLAV